MTDQPDRKDSSPAKTANQILVYAGEVVAGRRTVERAVIPITDLEPLARAYLAMAAGPAGATLAQTGPVYISLAAVREYMRAEHLGAEEEARRELTELVLDAKQSTERPDWWRSRKRSTGLDVQIRVAKERRLLVVTHVAVRRA